MMMIIFCISFARSGNNLCRNCKGGLDYQVARRAITFGMRGKGRQHFICVTAYEVPGSKLVTEIS